MASNSLQPLSSGGDLSVLLNLGKLLTASSIKYGTKSVHELCTFYLAHLGCCLEVLLLRISSGHVVRPGVGAVNSPS